MPKRHQEIRWRVPTTPTMIEALDSSGPGGAWGNDIAGGGEKKKSLEDFVADDDPNA
jgi:hypothetical protein